MFIGRKVEKVKLLGMSPSSKVARPVVVAWNDWLGLDNSGVGNIIMQTITFVSENK